MKTLLSLIVLLPLLTGALIAMTGSRIPRRLSGLAACGAVGGAFACSLGAFLSFRTPVTTE
ncbi:UDP-phosphate glucose phosphotransferase, partial [bacterium]|nr:UDP-phosphate glucose phosphotransferase [bacterium]